MEISASPQDGARAIVRVNFEPDLYRESAVTVSAWPQFGATVSVALTIVTGSAENVKPPIPDADLLAALPLAMRNIRVTVAGANPDAGPLGVGYSGAAHSIVATPGSRAALHFAPAESGGMTLSADGSVSPLTALSAGEMLTAVFSVTARISGGEFRAHRILVSVLATSAVFQVPQLNLLQNEALGNLLTLREHSPLLAGATFERTGAADSIDVSMDGLVSPVSAGELPARDAAYQMTVRARNPAVFLGDAYFRVAIKVNHPLFSANELEAVIPASERSVRRIAAAGWTGAIRHTIVSGDSSAELDLPSAPAGFSLDSSGRIALAGAFSGEEIEGVFQVTVRKAGRQNAAIPVRVAVGQPQTRTIFVAELVPDTSGDLFDFGAGDLGGAVFTRDSSSDSELALSAAGVFSAPSGLAEGTYVLSGSASGGDILGSIPIGASVDVKTPIPPVFGGVVLTESGASGTKVTVTAAWCVTLTTGQSSACTRAARTSPMFYHGQRRGLHWVLGGKINHSQHGVFAGPRVCAWGGTHEGRQWRLPTLGELAGGLASSNDAGFVAVTAIVVQTHLAPIVGAESGMEIHYNSGLATDASALPPLPDSGLHAYLSEVGNNWGGAFGGQQSPYMPFFTWTPGASGASLHSGNIYPGRAVCVLEAGDNYQRPPSLLGVRVKSDGGILTGNFLLSQGVAPEREARVSAPAAVSAAGAVYTLTATGWRVNTPGANGATGPSENLELPDAPLMMRLSGDSAGASFERSSVAGEGERVILRVDAAPTAERVLQLDIWPEFGLTVSIFVTLSVSTSGRAGSPDWEDDGSPADDVLAFSAKAGVFPARPAAGGGVLAGGLAFAAAGDLKQRELEHSGVFNSATTRGNTVLII